VRNHRRAGPWRTEGGEKGRSPTVISRYTAANGKKEEDLERKPELSITRGFPGTTYYSGTKKYV